MQATKWSGATSRSGGVSRILRASQGNERASHVQSLIIGCLGNGVGLDFIGFTNVYGDLPSREEVEKDPEKARLTKDASASYAVSSALLDWAKNTDEAVRFIPYILRLKKDLQAMIIRDFSKLHQGFIFSKEYLAWQQKYGATLV